VHCQHDNDFCHHPLKQGFDYFYGLPLTNAKDFGDDGDSVVVSRFKYFSQVFVAIGIGGIILCVFVIWKSILSASIVIPLFLLLALPTFYIYFIGTHLKLMNSLVMRNYEYVEQPIRFHNFTQRLVQEGVNFLEERKEDGKPFLLMMSWIQVHTVLHTSEEFRGHSVHGAYGDNVEEMDWSVGEIVGSLERLGMLNNTLVYFTSDNGGHLEEKGLQGNQEGGWNSIYRGSYF
jgi:steryl-sulfatase